MSRSKKMSSLLMRADLMKAIIKAFATIICYIVKHAAPTSSGHIVSNKKIIFGFQALNV